MSLGGRLRKAEDRIEYERNPIKKIWDMDDFAMGSITESLNAIFKAVREQKLRELNS